MAESRFGINIHFKDIVSDICKESITIGKGCLDRLRELEDVWLATPFAVSKDEEATIKHAGLHDVLKSPINKLAIYPQLLIAAKFLLI